VESLGVEAADVVIAPSEEAASDARRWMGIQRPIRIVPNCVDLDYIDGVVEPAVESPGDTPDEFRIVFSGRVDDTKGADTLDGVVGQLRANPLPRPVRVVVVGPYADLSRYPSLSVTSAAGLQVDMRGRVPTDAVLLELAHGHVYILPSRAETFCMGALEAMAVGTPVLGSSVGSIPDMVGRHGGGMLITTSDPCDWATAVRRLADDEGLRARMGLRARLTVEETFDAPKVAREWLKWCGLGGCDCGCPESHSGGASVRC
jgi:glycosyltransferase involved in cell wall biosynthesis